MPEILRVEVIPNSNKNQIIKGKSLIAKVKEPAAGGRANKAVAKLLSRYFSKRVRIISGGRNRRKVIQVG